MNLYNVVELMVKNAVEQTIESTGHCSCNHCKLDASAVALNHLKPHYVVTPLGEALTRTSYLSAQKQAEVVSEVIKAIDFVSQNPRHAPGEICD